MNADARFLPGDRDPSLPADFVPSAEGLPPVPAMLGTAVDTALLLLEARRWWLVEYVDHPMRDVELEALTAALAALELALDAQRRGSPPRFDDPR